MCMQCAPPPEDSGHEVSRRRLIGGTLAGAVGAAVLGRTTPARAQPTRLGRSSATLRWLGVAGWELAFGGRSLLIDPYISRFEYRVPGKPDIDPDAPVVEDRAAIERVVSRHLATAPDFILVTHGHWDHIADVPYLLDRPGWAGATIRTICTETHWHLLEAMGTSGKRLGGVIVAQGGERLRFPPGAERDEPLYTIEVVRSLHSQFGGYGYFAPGTLTAAPATRPTRISELLEGGTLAFQVTVGGLRVLFLSGTANFAEREVRGLRPDVLVLGMSGYAAIDRYTERALRATGGPAIVIPDHHDDMITPLDAPNIGATVNPGAVTALRETARRLRLRTRVLDPRHLEPIEL